MKLYHYNKCSTCRNALKYLKERNIAVQEIDITKTPPTKKELLEMLNVYEGNIRKLFNTSGQMYRELGLKDTLASMSKEEAIDLLSKNGKLVKRPFLLSGKGGVVGFREEDWDTVL